MIHKGVARWLVLALCLGAPSCGPRVEEHLPIGIDWSLAPDPPRVGAAAFTCTLWDSTAGQPLTGARIQIEGNMAHAGMRPVFADARETAPGTYAAEFEFTMAGDWFILLDVELADGRTMRRQIDVNGVGAR